MKYLFFPEVFRVKNRYFREQQVLLGKVCTSGKNRLQPGKTGTSGKNTYFREEKKFKGEKPGTSGKYVYFRDKTGNRRNTTTKNFYILFTSFDTMWADTLANSDILVT
jgi:hypothetical protein